MRAHLLTGATCTKEPIESNSSSSSPSVGSSWGILPNLALRRSRCISHRDYGRNVAEASKSTKQHFGLTSAEHQQQPLQTTRLERTMDTRLDELRQRKNATANDPDPSQILDENEQRKSAVLRWFWIEVSLTVRMILEQVIDDLTKLAESSSYLWNKISSFLLVICAI